MGKERFSAFDVCAETSIVRRRCLGLTLNQIYDAEKRALVFKFNKPSGVAAQGDDEKDDLEKLFLVISPGTKFHLTRYFKSASASSAANEWKKTSAASAAKDGPSNFVQKLRKHCKQKRLNDVRQLGQDRAIMLTFGQPGERCARVIVELYAQGNCVLVDDGFMVMTLLRSHVDKAKDVMIMGNKRYPVEMFKSFKMPTRAVLDDAFVGKYLDADEGEEKRVVVVIDDNNNKANDDNDDDDEKKKGIRKEEQQRAPQTLRECLCRAFSFSPSQVEHVALSAGIEKGMLAQLPLESEAMKQKLFECIEEEFKWFQDVTEGKRFPVPEVTLKELTMEVGAEKQIVEVFDDFSHHPMKQNERKKTVSIKEILQIDNDIDMPNKENIFNDVLDEYYAKMELQQGVVQRSKAEAQALKKFDKLKKDQENRLKVLERDAEKEAQRAELISRNVKDVENVLNAVNDALVSGMAWDDLESMIGEEKRRGNPVAKLISSLDLKNNQVTIKLTPKDDVEIDETTGNEVVLKKNKPIEIPLDLGLSAFANCNARFNVKKKHDLKLDKTAMHHDRVVSDAEKKAVMKIESLREKAIPGAKAVRKPFWFEKFIWWITSENCLVLHATDNTQAEMLFAKYANRSESGNDCFIFCDEKGAPPITLIKPPPAYSSSSSSENYHGDGGPMKVPSLSIAQAAQATVAKSECWQKKRSSSAWWARACEVSKHRWDLPEHASLLPNGSFTLVKSARKKFLPPSKPEMGFALLFAVSASDIEKHEKERMVKSESADETFYDQKNESSMFVEVSVSSEGEEEEEEEEEGKKKEEEVEALAAKLDKTRVDASANSKSGKKSTKEVDKTNEVVTAVKKKRISAAQRKQMKKKGNDGNEDDDDDVFVDPLKASATADIEEEGDDEEDEGDDEEEENRASKVVAPKVRGKTSKAKRAAKKYAEQDDEDRELAVKLLTTKQKETKKDRKKAAAAAALNPSSSASSTKKQIKANDPDAESESVRESVVVVLPDAPEPAMPSNFKERGIKPLIYKSISEETADDDDGIDNDNDNDNDEDDICANDDDDDDDDDDDAVEEKTGTTASIFERRDKQTELALRQLTATPNETDSVQFAIPICAPFSVLAQYKFRLKIIPGTQKRGKTIKECAFILSKAPFASDRERSLAKEALELKTEDCCRALPPGGCKVTLPPGALNDLNKSKKQRGQKMEKTNAKRSNR